MKKIIIGNSGSGKSKRCFEIANEYDGTVAYLNGVPNAERYYEKHGIATDFEIKRFGKHIAFEDDTKYFITPIYEPDIYKEPYILPLDAASLLFGYGEMNDFVRNLTNKSNLLIIMDDGYWSRAESINKILCLWRLSHSDKDIVITVDNKDVLFDGFDTTDKMLEDLSKYWEIEYLDK